jgi:tRNA(Ile)-lysidine synthase
MKQSLLEKFIEYNSLHKLADAKKRILIAVSGGLDSVVLCGLFKHAGFQFAIAHCNFKLRGTESDADATFVHSLAEQYKAKFYSKEFDTKQYADAHKCSIQVAAREMRYAWFEELQATEKFDFIATAHHLNDNIETVLFNLAKGTGIKGLRGILPKHDKLIRPLLFAPREEIEAFAKQHNLSWREDSSNASDKYSRNFIRHNIVPLFKELNPSFETSFANNLNIFSELETQFDAHFRKVSKTLFFSKHGDVYIAIEALKKLSDRRTILFTYLQPHGFTSSQVDDILSGLNNNAGRQFFTDNARLIQDRKFLILTKGNAATASEHFIYDDISEILTSDFVFTQIKLENKNSEIEKSPFIAMIDASKILYPLVLRRWKAGDYFYPIGMNNKKKKLKKFLTDIKLPLHEKEKVWVVESDKKIVWVVGLRLDERFKITEQTEQLVRLQVGKQA